MRRYQPGEDFTNLIETALPEHVRAEYPMFVDFVKLFLTYLEQERTFAEQTVSSEYGSLVNNQVLTTETLGGVSYEMRKFLEYRDIDTTLDDFVPHFLQMFAKNFPRRTFVSPDRFVTTLRYLYTHKSVEDTITWFFRVLFNEHAQLYYPREDILKASDGTWVEETTIKVTAPTNGFTNQEVVQHYTGQIIKTATGRAQVDSVTTTVVGQSFGQYLFVNELILKRSTIIGTFSAGQDVWNIDSVPEVHTTIIPVITAINVLSGGGDYVAGDIVLVSEGPGLGEGFDADGVVTSVSQGPLSGVAVNSGGDGYVIGDPVNFISSTGANAEAYVDQIIAGNLLLDGESGVFLAELQVTGDRTFLALEDHDNIPQDLSIEAFLTANVPFDAVDYSAANQPTWNVSTTLDYVFASIGSVPFMHPWTFGDFTGNTANVTLANTMLTADMTNHDIFFTSNVNVFVLSSATDTASNSTNASIKGRALVVESGIGLNRNRIFVTNTELGFAVGQVIKTDGPANVALGVVTCNTGSANVSGSGTNFVVQLAPLAHILIGANPYVVKSITNSSFLTLYTRPVANATGSAYSIAPTGVIRTVTDMAQRAYGKIRHVAFLSPGAGYLTPPLVTVNSVSAQAQALYHYDP